MLQQNSAQILSGIKQFFNFFGGKSLVQFFSICEIACGTKITPMPIAKPVTPTMRLKTRKNCNSFIPTSCLKILLYGHIVILLK